MGRAQVFEDQAAVGRAVAVIVEAENEVVAFDQNPRRGRIEVQDQGLPRHIIRNNRLACSRPVQDDSALRLPDGLLGLTGDEFFIDGFVTAGLDLIAFTLQIVGHSISPNYTCRQRHRGPGRVPRAVAITFAQSAQLLDRIGGSLWECCERYKMKERGNYSF